MVTETKKEAPTLAHAQAPTLAHAQAILYLRLGHPVGEPDRKSACETTEPKPAMLGETGFAAHTDLCSWLACSSSGFALVHAVPFMLLVL